MILSDGIIGSIFISDEVHHHYETSRWVELILKVESALARAQAELDIIPQEAATAIGSLEPPQFDFGRLKNRTAEVGFPIVAIVEQIAEVLDDGLGQYVHWGATTQDVIDTVQALQVSSSMDRLEQTLHAVGDRLAGLADAERATLMLARSQGQAALPTTFGLRAAGWLSGISRHLERLDETRSRVLLLQLSGAVGTAASFGPHAEEVHAKVASLLGLKPAPVNWHTQRDKLAEVGSVYAGIAGSLGKIGLDVASASQSGIGELSEVPRGTSSGTSSTMPQKQNPILSQQLMQNARIVRALSPLLVEALVTDHDRGMGIWPVEWFALPQVMALTETSAAKAQQLLTTLTLDRDALAANLGEQSNIMAEAVMMSLASEIGRQEAHDRLIDIIRSHPDLSLRDALAAEEVDVDPEVLAPSSYLGTTGRQIDEAIAGFERVAAGRRN